MKWIFIFIVIIIGIQLISAQSDSEITLEIGIAEENIQSMKY